jgi:hypothetical protein
MIGGVAPAEKTQRLLIPASPRRFLGLLQRDSPLSQHGEIVARNDHGEITARAS